MISAITLAVSTSDDRRLLAFIGDRLSSAD
jgi:hypothetical protein